MAIQKPTLQLNFARAKRVDSCVTFTRASTATYYGDDGLLKIAPIDTPRIDYEPVTGTCKGLLIEEQRTNYALYSETPKSGGSRVRADITNDVITAPDGTMTGDKFIEDTSVSNSHYHGPAVATVAPNQTVTFSIYAKAGERSWFAVFVWDSGAASNQVKAYFNLSTGLVGTVAASGNGTGATAAMAPVGGGWYRCSISGKPNTSGTATGVGMYLATADNSYSYTGDGTSGLYIWGAQLEAGEFPTSYIPTTSAAAIRYADIASVTGIHFSSRWNAAEGTVVCQSQLAWDIPASTRFPLAYSISDGTTNSRINNGSANTVGIYIVSNGGVGQVADYPAESETIVKRTAFAFKANDFAHTLNGAAVTTDTSGSMPTVNRLDIGNRYDAASTYTINGHIARITYFNTRLPDAQLVQLTRIV